MWQKKIHLLKTMLILSENSKWRLNLVKITFKSKINAIANKNECQNSSYYFYCGRSRNIIFGHRIYSENPVGTQLPK